MPITVISIMQIIIIIILYNYYTELYYGYQRSTGKKSEKFQLNCEQQKNSIVPNYRLMRTKQHTETCYRTKKPNGLNDLSKYFISAKQWFVL